MDMGKFKRLTPEQQNKVILNTMEQTGIAIDISGHSAEEYDNGRMYGHSEEKHQNIDITQLLKRVVDEGHSVSVFDKDEYIRSFIESIICEKVDDVVSWLTNREEWRLEVTCDMREYVGCGIDSNFNEKRTDYLTIVLQKDISWENDLGFNVVTAYPNIDHEKAELTGRGFRDIGKQMIVRSDSYACKAFWATKNTLKNTKIRNIGTEQKMLKEFKTVNGNRYRIQITGKTNTRLEQFNEKEKRFIRFSTVEYEKLPLSIKDYTEKVITAVNNNIEKVERCKRVPDEVYKKMCNDLNESYNKINALQTR